MSFNIHPLTNDPTSAWEEISKSQEVTQIEVKIAQTPVTNDNIRFVCMSDTHSLTSHIEFEVPDGDVFIHAGDFTESGEPEEIKEFNTWLGYLPHRHKIVIAGNHELSFDPSFTCCGMGAMCWGGCCSAVSLETTSNLCSPWMARQLLTNCHYLEDSGLSLYGISIYGTPWQPEFSKRAFNLKRGAACQAKWACIPDHTDVLVTHTPPLGHGDRCWSGKRAGCVELLTEVQTRVQPRYHVFGHIHEGYGVSSDGQVIYINASTCNVAYRPINYPVVFDIPLPPGFSKEQPTRVNNFLTCCFRPF